jgi:hypothetical protein
MQWFSPAAIATESSSQRQPALLPPNPLQAANKNRADPLKLPVKTSSPESWRVTSKSTFPHFAVYSAVASIFANSSSPVSYSPFPLISEDEELHSCTHYPNLLFFLGGGLRSANRCRRSTLLLGRYRWYPNIVVPLRPATLKPHRW